jgi:hypothetical protein
MRKGPQGLSIGAKIALRIVMGIPLAMALWWLPIANPHTRASVAIVIAFAVATAVVALIDRHWNAQGT